MSESNQDAAAGAAGLTPPEALQVAQGAQVMEMIALKPEIAQDLDRRVDRYVQDLLAAELGSEDFRAKLDAANALGRQSIAGSSAITGRFMDKNFVGFETSPAFQAINGLRDVFSELNPAHAGDLLAPRRLFGLIPFGNRLQAYFRKFDSAGGEIAKLMEELRTSQNSIRQDIASLADMEAQLWQAMSRVREASYFAERLDHRLGEEAAALRQSNLLKAEALEQEVLFHARQALSDLLAQQTVNVNAYRQIGILKKTGRELVIGCDRMATTGMSALATAQAVARATGAQVKVMEMLNEGSKVIGDLIEQTSTMIGKHVEATGDFSSNPVIGVDRLKAAFDNTSRAIDTLDKFRSQALDTMSKNNMLLKGLIDHAEQEIAARRGAVSTSDVAERLVPT